MSPGIGANEIHDPQAAVHFDTSSPWGAWKPRGAAAFCLELIDLLPANRITRKLAFLLRKLIKTGTQGIYDRRIWDLYLRLGARGNLTEQRWLTMTNFHDAPEREALASVLHPGAVFVDIGANAGFYTFWALAQKQPGLRVIAVEPSEVMLERMRHNLAVNGFTGSVTLFPCAVTAAPCEVIVERHEGNAGQTTVRQEGGGRRVPGRPLLDLLQEAAVVEVAAMKIDIEGLEVPVLEAFFNTAPRQLWPRLIIGEIVGPGGGPLENLLVAHGYQLGLRTKMNGILVLPDASP
ncbi:FkbM family methyltransferase [Luteolibacter yonseiensis]|uniref:FkbM family methyltransferase n=2 Tax=Luteolibacter yonseiensis TaxID=1144680 RepID=A0A934R4H6_9BACT|nr:FkbM family methyltransferase [Luteolibacter yonseiensis]MBK1816986.1 FkbM family methyltransferase [Luteolibacter yonseiensis]